MKLKPKQLALSKLFPLTRYQNLQTLPVAESSPKLQATAGLRLLRLLFLALWVWQ
jgi:hypothetical protein